MSIGSVTALFVISLILLVCAIYIYCDTHATLTKIRSEDREDDIG